jgi:hypothetical protein
MLWFKRVHSIEETQWSVRGCDQAGEFSQESVSKSFLKLGAQWHELRLQYLQKGLKGLKTLFV